MRTNFKRVIALFMGIAMMLGCIGCTKDSGPETTGGTQNETEVSQNLNSEGTGAAEADSTGVSAEDAGNEIGEQENASDSGETGTEASETGDDEMTEENTKPVIDNTVEEKCPVSAYTANTLTAQCKTEHVTYYSTTCGMGRGVSIVLPAGYSEEKQYGVLYMLHGIFGDEYSFTNDSGNKIKEIVTNMTADYGMDELIIVYPNMYATSDPEQKPAMNATDILPYDNFVNDMVNDLMPFIESNYPVKTGRENTLLAGFSMGGRETLYISHVHPELFGYVCAISPAPGLTPGTDWAMEHPGTITEDELKYEAGAVLPEVLIVCCGTKDSVVGQFPKSYHEIMERNTVDHIWFEIEGADHDNNAIRSGVYNLLKQVAYLKAKEAERAADRAERMSKMALILPSKCLTIYPGDRGTIEYISYMAHDYKGDGPDVEKKAYVYLPAGYDETKQYNVIYLLHGIGGDEREWGLDQGTGSRVKMILDALIGDGDIEPVIVVTPNGKALALSDCNGNDRFYQFGYELRNDLISYMESHYATYADYSEDGYDMAANRKHRAVAGLSMGGMQTINIGMCECLDLFSWFGAFSAAPTTYDASKIAAAVKASKYSVDFFYNICGLQDNIAYWSASAAAKNLPAFSDDFIDGENFMWNEKSGGHDTNIWNLGFYNFALIAF